MTEHALRFVAASIHHDGDVDQTGRVGLSRQRNGVRPERLATVVRGSSELTVGKGASAISVRLFERVA